MRALLVTGQPSCGKTTLVKKLVREVQALEMQADRLSQGGFVRSHPPRTSDRQQRASSSNSWEIVPGNSGARTLEEMTSRASEMAQATEAFQSAARMSRGPEPRL